jgi:hypothetical protein
MYWVSPSDDKTNSNMLYYLTVGGLQQVLEQVATIVSDDVKHLTLYQMTFIIVNFCRVSLSHRL